MDEERSRDAPEKDMKVVSELALASSGGQQTGSRHVVEGGLHGVGWMQRTGVGHGWSE